VITEPLWRCGTCRCRIRQRNVDDQPGTFVRVEFKCPAHESVPDDELWDVLLGRPDSECAKAAAVARALLNTPETSRVDEKTGEVSLTVVPNWRECFVGKGADRSLVVTIPGQKPDELRLAEINGQADKDFGVGKVTVR
jgi:hypothetical protein